MQGTFGVASDIINILEDRMTTSVCHGGSHLPLRLGVAAAALDAALDGGQVVMIAVEGAMKNDISGIYERSVHVSRAIHDDV